MNKTVAVLLVISSLTLTGCSSLTPEQQKEADSFNKWSEAVYEKESFSYDKDSELKLYAEDELKPIFDTLFTTLPSGRIGLNVDLLEDNRWTDKVCKDYKDDKGNIILEPLANPIIGDKSLAIVNGYISGQQLLDLSKALKVELKESAGENLLVGSDVTYLYEPKKYSFEVTTANFKIIVEGDTGWNTILWKEYQSVEDPGRWSEEENPMLTDEYMPVTVRVYYTRACEEPKPYFDLNSEPTQSPTP